MSLVSLPLTMGAAPANCLNEVETLHFCPLCSATSFRPLPTPRRWIGKAIFPSAGTMFGLQRCQRCSLAFVNPRPAPVLLNAFYNSDDYLSHNPDAGCTNTARYLLERVAQHGPYPGKRFLDFGCGGGFLLRAAVDGKWNAVGYDVGQRALASCKSQGLTAIDNFDKSPSSSFDVIFLNHVFEHVAEPQTVLSQCWSLLKKGGKLFVVVPNLAGIRARFAFPFLSRRFKVDERHRAFPIHLFYYTHRTLTQTLEKYGFRVGAVETFGFGMEAFLYQPGVGGNGAAKRPAKRTTSAFREMVKKNLFGAGLGENLMAVAQRIQG